MFDLSVINEILDAWAADQRHPERGRWQKPFPAIEDIRLLVETAFWASLKREEDRPISFSMAMIHPSEIEDEFETSERRQLVLVFDRPLKLTLETVIKIVPAFSPQFTTLAISPCGLDGTGFEIWGALFYSSLSNPLQDIPVWIPDQTFSRPDVFTITAVSPGSLMISRGNSQIGRFVSGHFIPAVPTPFSTWAMGSPIKTILSENTNGSLLFYDINYWHLYSACLDYLLSEISFRGHGGSLIFLPEIKASEFASLFFKRYAFSANLRIKALLDELHRLPADASSAVTRLGYNRKLSERLSALAQLACIDGALIITETFSILSFGATLKAPRWKGRVIIGPYGFSPGGDVFDHPVLGTRHHSVINFVGACSQSIGFVISQDGPIRRFIRHDEDTMLCWPDCRVSMFI